VPKLQQNLVWLVGGLFALTVIAVLWANLVGSTDTRDAFARWGLLGVVGEVVALFVLITRGIVLPRTYSVTLGPPEDMPGFNFSRIAWDKDRCRALCAGLDMKVTPVRSAIGGSFEIVIPPEILAKTTETQPIELRLIDKKGYTWEVQSFHVFQRTVILEYMEQRDEIIAAYSPEKKKDLNVARGAVP
jgi:hypothetical protein